MTIDSQWDAIYKNEAALYTKKVIFTDAANSDAFLFPIGINSISAYISDSNTLTVLVTISNKNNIEDDTANWVEWDGFSQFNPAITALKVVATGAGIIEISVRGILS